MNKTSQNLAFRRNVNDVKQKLSSLFGPVKKQHHRSHVNDKGPLSRLGRLTISTLGELAFRVLQLGVCCLMLLALLRVLVKSLVFRQSSR